MPAQSTQLPVLENSGSGKRKATLCTQEMGRPIDLYSELLLSPQHNRIDAVTLIRDKVFFDICAELAQRISYIALQLRWGSLRATEGSEGAVAQVKRKRRGQLRILMSYQPLLKL